jgi:hypothetical protein
MPVIFSAQLDGSPAVRYQPVSLVVFYLRQVRSHVTRAQESPRGEGHLAEAMLAVVLSALCLEAFANEAGEDLVPAAELTDFLKGRKAYREPRGLGSVARKLVILFGKKWSHDLRSNTELMDEIRVLFGLRNALVHYNVGESAAKAFLQPVPMIRDPDSGVCMTVLDFEQRATRMEPALVGRVDAKAAARGYNTAVRVLRLWNEKSGAPANALSGHPEFTI